MDEREQLREHLVSALQGGLAFDTFEEVAGGFTGEERGQILTGAEHSAWQIIDHMRRTLVDILDFSENEDGSYKERSWPMDYWAAEPMGDWERTVNAYSAARGKMEKLVRSSDLYRVFPWGQGQTLLREAMLAANHEAYHVGELVELQRWLRA